MGWVNRLMNALRPAPVPDSDTRRRIAQAAHAIDPLILQVGHYEQTLAPAVCHAVDYCATIAARIPGPVAINRAAFVSDPLVHALFASADDIETMLARSQCVRDHLPAMALGSGRCCALLGMRLHQTAGFGTQLEGGTVHTDVAQETLYFSDHTLAEPSPDPEAARLHLRDVLFDGLVKSIAGTVAAVRTERASLHQDQSIALARQRAGHSRPGFDATLEQLHQRLSATDDALQPGKLLDTLAAALSAPETYLHLDPIDVRVDRNGVIAKGSQEADLLRFAELNGRDSRRWVVLLAFIDHDDARQALDRFETARHYIVI